MESFPKFEKFSWRDRIARIGEKLIIFACYSNLSIPPPEVYEQMVQMTTVHEETRPECFNKIEQYANQEIK